MIKKKILVMTDHMPWGHRSIARAIYGFLKSKEKKENFEVYYAEVKSEMGVSNDIYMFSYRYLPLSNRIARWISYSPQIRKVVEELSESNLAAPKKVVQKIKPDLIISAYWFHSHSLAGWKDRENLNFNLWTVVADPWTVLPVSYNSKIDMHLVYDQVGVDVGMKECGIPRSKILESGWWTRPEMFEKFDRKLSRKKLGFDDDRPVIFVGGGSLGTNSLTKLLPALMLIRGKAGFVFNTGTDKLAYNLVEQYIRLYKKLNKNGNLIIKNLGWIENMGEVLAGVDIVFGKAGPNFLFDVVASKKPFVAITHIGGQEDGNIDLIKKKGLGWVKEKGTEAADFLLAYLDNPRKYQEKFKKNIEAEAKRNKMSMEIILDRVKKELG
jgi:UDP-N-acetylglucosamine:LPS N-acetylglucosamine transferase